MRKIIYIFSLIVGILLNASADVYKLKLQGSIEVKEKREDTGSTQEDKYIFVNKEEFSPGDWIDFDKQGTGTKEYKNPKEIYVNAATKEVFICVKGIENSNDRREVAKRQFENILNWGLITKEGSFDEKVFNVNFKLDLNTEQLSKEEGNKKYKNDEKVWQMPGIAVRILGNSEEDEFPVMCCMKRKSPTIKGKNEAEKTVIKNSFITGDDWKSLSTANKGIYNFEHTERQLMYSLLFGNITLKSTKQTKTEDEVKNRVLEPGGGTKEYTKPVDWDSFFIWTKGNPCIAQDGWLDNGGYCCAYWYKEIIKELLPETAKVFLYFSDNEIQARFTKPTSQNDVLKDLVVARAKDSQENKKSEDSRLEVTIYSVDKSPCTTQRKVAIPLLDTWSKLSNSNTTKKTGEIKYCDHLSSQQ